MTSVVLEPAPSGTVKLRRDGTSGNARALSARTAAVCRSTASAMAGSTRRGRVTSWCAASARR
ncbi:hypothetical protein [Streptomyces kebangsaanensis]|uniref:hypothetical protein n=1 Tax=Streptomyces kebangsaanensis TaxID=864058 RepID=UPI0013011BCD|nr:hypothetical protein [Streptomyces kebangsaanensis]